MKINHNHITNDFQELHKRAELSFQELKTSQYIADRLTQAGISYQTIAGTGILATIGNNSQNALLLRADMDALPIQEATNLKYASTTPNVMHACGHDFHSAVLLNVLIAIQKNPPKDRTILGLFQPGEEVAPGGAKLVLETGVLSNYNIKYALGLHTSTELTTGTVGICKGAFMASSDELHFSVRGTAGHAAIVPQSENPVWRSAEFLSALHNIEVPKDTAHILSIGRVEALGATNVIPASVEIQGTLRTFSEEHRHYCKAQISRLIEEYDVENRMVEGYDVLYNNEELCDKAIEIITSKTPLTIKTIPPRLTSEDFSRFSQLYPSLFLRVGVTESGREATKAHTSSFRVDPNALKPCAEMMQAIAFNIKIM